MTPADEPALEDDTTARLFEQRIQYVRGHTWLWLTSVTALGLTVAMWRDDPGLALPMSGFMLVGVWQLMGQGWQPSQRWIPAARRLLEDEPWQETPVTVLATRGTVLALPDGSYARVYGVTAPVREMIVRSGRVWTVGPDVAGWMAVRIDGLHTPWPTKLVRAVRAEPATPSVEPVVAVWTRHLVADRRGDLVFAVLATVALTAITVVMGEWPLVALIAAAGAVVAGIAIHRLRTAIRLCAAGNWRQARAAVSWTRRWNWTAEGTVELVFPDGHRFVARLDGVPVDVLATAWREEVLWVADGGVVGFPDYPLAAFAAITPVGVSSDERLGRG